MEISQRIYMDEASFAWDEALASDTQRTLRDLLEATT
jgi:N-formylglutamate amidohydrolase